MFRPPAAGHKITVLSSTLKMNSRITKHAPVMVGEVLRFLRPSVGRTFLDATFGGGGHSRAILALGAAVLAIDRDPATAELAEPFIEEFADQFRYRNLPFDQIGELSERFDGIVIDLGLSTDQLEQTDRGFSFARDERLDMRFDQRAGPSAADLLNRATKPELERIFRDLAEDRQWRGLARKIVDNRRRQPYQRTGQLVETIGTDQPKVLAPIFQGLRIAVNDELTVLVRALAASKSCLKIGGTLVVISFQSLEDRIVKNFFRQEGWEVLTKKPVSPTVAELAVNPRSRSAKLRAGRFLGLSQE